MKRALFCPRPEQTYSHPPSPVPETSQAIPLRQRPLLPARSSIAALTNTSSDVRGTPSIPLGHKRAKTRRNPSDSGQVIAIVGWTLREVVAKNRVASPETGGRKRDTQQELESGPLN